MTYKDIPGYCDFHDFYKYVFDQLPDGALTAEIGVYLGHSVAYMASLSKESGKKIVIYAVDTFQGSQEHKSKGKTDFGDAFWQNMFACDVRNYVTTMTGSSVWAASTLHETFDFVFIDAAHDYESVKADIEAWRPKVKSGGILAGHDYCKSWPGVMEAVDELIPNRQIIKNVWWTRIP